jgi:hypothetical protein
LAAFAPNIPVLLNMKKKSLFLLFSLIGNLLIAQHSPNILLHENWSGYPVGDFVSDGTWRVQAADRGSLRIVEKPSPFGNSLNALRIEDKTDDSWGPRVVGNLPYPVSEPITISFDFFLDGISNDQPTFKLGGAFDEPVESGLWLSLQNNGFPTSIPGMNVVNRLSGNNGNRISMVETGRWYHVVLEIGNPTQAIFNIVLTPYGGEPIRVNNLSFRGQLSDFRNVNFFTNADRGTGIIYVSNVMVKSGIEAHVAAEFKNYQVLAQAAGAKVATAKKKWIQPITPYPVVDLFYLSQRQEVIVTMAARQHHLQHWNMPEILHVSGVRIIRAISQLPSFSGVGCMSAKVLSSYPARIPAPQLVR